MDDQSGARTSFLRQLSSDLLQSLQGVDKDDQRLFSLVRWWERKGMTLERRDLTLLEMTLKNILVAKPPPAFGKTDDDGRTVLHLAIIHRLPQLVILVLIKHMKKSELDQEDKNGRRAVDYLLDWEDVSDKVLKSLVDGGVNLAEQRNFSISRHPLVRLCRRTLDGHELLEMFSRSLTSISQKFRNRMLEEAIRRGSFSTARYLIHNGARAEDGKYLLHYAATANHDYLDKVSLLIHSAKLDPSQANEKMMTLLHVAADGNPPKIDLLVLALEEGVNPNKQDENEDTALHKVTKNYTERTTPWKESEQAMELLLKDSNPNLTNAQGLTPLGILMRAKGTLPVSLLWKWLENHADVTDGDLGGWITKCSLTDMSRRPDGHVLLRILISKVDNLKLQDYLKCMLEAAVKDGSAETVEMLLDNGASAEEGNGWLLEIAACSKSNPDVKLCHLKKFGANPNYRDLQGNSVLHLIAKEDTTEEVLQTCTKKNQLHLGFDLTDNDGNTPLHIAAKSEYKCSEMFFGDVSGRQLGRDPNAVNSSNETPLQLVLRHNHSNKELLRNKVMLLLMSGCKSRWEDFAEYGGDAEDFQKLFLSTEVLFKSSEPLHFLLELAHYCKVRLRKELDKHPDSQLPDWTCLQWRNMNDDIENSAVMVIEELGKGKKFVGWGMETNDYFPAVLELGWHKFLANQNVGKILERKFYGQVDMYNAEEKMNKNTLGPQSWRTLYLLPWQVFLFMLRCLLLPFCVLIMACCRDTARDKIIRMLYIDPRKLPIVTFFSCMVSYMVFLGLLIVHIVDESPRHVFRWFDWILLLYVVAMAVEEIYQIINDKWRYASITNACDIAMIVCFSTFFLVRLLEQASDDLTMRRVSEYVFAVAVGLSFLRLLYYMQVNHKLGPILISFKAIWAEVASFVLILGIVLVAFGTALAVVYNAGVYTADFQNGTISLPPLVSGVWPTLQTMYWSLYGQIDYQQLQSEHEVLHPESVFGLLLFALWSLVSVIVLLNMLIALINEAFDRVKKQNADLVWNLAVYNIITDIEQSPSFPLPMNLFYITVSILKITWLKSIFEKERSSKEKLKSGNAIKINQWIEAKSKEDKTAEANSKEDRTARKLDLVEALEFQISTLKTELSRGIKTLRSQTKQRLKRVHTCLRRQNSRTAEKKDYVDGQLRDKDNEKFELAILSNSDSDSDSDMDEEEQGKVRHERVCYNGNTESATISYIGANGKVGSCQFLNKDMPHTLQYFEVTIADYGRAGSIGIGLADRSYPLNKMPGLRKGSVAYHCGKGHLFHENVRGTIMASPTQQGDVIGCGINCYATSNGTERSAIVFFTRNGEELGIKKVTLPKSGFFPIVALRSEGERVKVDLNAKWKSPEDLEDDFQLQHDRILKISTGKKGSSGGGVDIDFDVLQPAPDSPSNGKACPLKDELTHGPAVPTVDLSPHRAEFVCVMGNLLKYGSDSLTRVGVYQSLIRPMSREYSYYEVTVKDYGKNGTIGIGLARRNYPLDQQPGWRSGSIAWHCDNGGLYIENPFSIVEFTPGKSGDTIGCGIDFEASGELFDRQVGDSENGESHESQVGVYFTHNGKRILEETIKEPEGGLYPTVGMHSPGEIVEISLSAATSTTPTLKRGARAERVNVDGNVISFANNQCDNPCSEVGGVQLMQYNMKKLNYFEVTIVSGGEESAIGIGIASSKYAFDCQPGFGDESISYHCNTGYCFRNGGCESYSHTSSAKDVIGCGIRYIEDKLHVFFTRNGKQLVNPMCFEKLQPSELYPTVRMDSPGEKVKINVNAHCDENYEETLFSRWDRIEIDGNKASYEPDECNKVGAVQLSRKISEEYPYFEVEVTSFGEEGRIGVGLAPKDYPLDCEPGWLPGSVGYHCDDGCLFEGRSWEGKSVHNPGVESDRLGCGVKYPRKKGDKLTVFFTHNGEEVDKQTELRRPSCEGLFPTIGMQSRGEAITVIKNAKWTRPKARETAI